MIRRWTENWYKIAVPSIFDGLRVSGAIAMELGQTSSRSWGGIWGGALFDQKGGRLQNDGEKTLMMKKNEKDLQQQRKIRRLKRMKMKCRERGTRIRKICSTAHVPRQQHATTFCHKHQTGMKAEHYGNLHKTTYLIEHTRAGSAQGSKKKQDQHARHLDKEMCNNGL